MAEVTETPLTPSVENDEESCFPGLIIGAVIRYTSHPNTQRTAHAVLDNYSTKTTPEAVFITMNVTINQNSTVERTIKYSLDKIVTSVEEEAPLEKTVTFDPEIFFNVFLPVIIFEAGYSMKRRHFFRNFGAIVMYAFVGTTVSCMVVGGLMFAITRFLPFEFTVNDCFFFGAIISATDPVTVLAIFNDLNVDVTLYALVFGESVLNDAVAIVLSGSVEAYGKGGGGEGFSVNALFKALGNFLGIFGGAFLIGSVFGMVTALLTKYTKLRDFPVLETALFFLMGAIAYALAIRNTSTEARKHMLSATMMIVLVTVILCGGFVTPVLQLLKIRVGVEDEEPHTEQSADVRTAMTRQRQYSTMEVPRGATGATSPPSQPSSYELKIVAGQQIVPLLNESQAEQDIQSRSFGKAYLVAKWYKFDRRFLKPFLTNSRPNLMETCPGCCMPLAKMLTTQEQLMESGFNNDEDSDTEMIINHRELSIGEHSEISGSPSVNSNLDKEHTEVTEEIDLGDNQLDSFPRYQEEISGDLGLGQDDLGSYNQPMRLQVNLGSPTGDSV
ncbi:SL9A7-like protein [Mya arenaria]|uniref:SL9A7-like protein n=1 Tax=Mya arenaria TaxID=6604 RepID=A0ABY7G423_MYAAR|nr:SL9A7-like protein [Mya arenaria]